MGIQVMLSFSFTIVAILGTVFVSSALLLRFSYEMRVQEDSGTQNILSQVNFNLDDYLKRIMHVSDTIYYGPIKNTDLAEDNISDEFSLLYEDNKEYAVSLSLFDAEGNPVESAPFNELKQAVNPTTTDWLSSALTRMENFHFFTPGVQNLFLDPDYAHQWTLPVSRYVELTYDGRITDGVLLVDMRFDGIAQICQNAELSNGGYVYLIDRDGEIIYHPKQQLIYSGIFSENNVVAATYSDGTHFENFSESDRHVTVKSIGYTGWKLVGVVPAQLFLLDTSQFLVFVTTLLFFGLLMVFLNLRISSHIATPIKQLDNAVKRFEAGTKDIEISADGCSEVQHLAKSIESMVRTLERLQIDIIKRETDKRRIELEVLQSQINPHFLYNSLDSVIWMTESGQYEEAITMVTSLARLFRIALSRGSNIIPVDSEIAHAKHYLVIQKIRYKNKFDTRITIDEDTKTLYTLKLCVQPLLENAIYHGMASADGDGLIELCSKRMGDDLIIEVRDNGLGMRPEVCAGLLQNKQVESTSGSGIGLYNVHRRIKLAFGEEYGLDISSEPDVGTSVRIKIPALTPEQAKSTEVHFDEE